MTAQDIIAALDLPGNCRVDQPVSKKLLIENVAPNSSDKRQINNCIERIDWLAALKPNNIGVAEYRDDACEYLEIAVLSVTLKLNADVLAKPGRIAELIHRAIPYPTVLLLHSQQGLMLSVAHKRWALNEAGKVILDGDVVAVTLLDDPSSPVVETEFLQALALRCQPQATLHALYQGWIDSVQALQAAQLTGGFKLADNPEQASRRRQALQDCQRLELEAAGLRAQAGKEKQLVRRVELNLKLARVKTELTVLRQFL